jgi:hypothetical protein
MANIFGKDPHKGKSTHAELERLNAERKQKLALAAQKFNQKKVTPEPKPADNK